MEVGVASKHHIEWRPVAGFPGYEASSDGHVRSIDRDVLCKNGVTIHKPSVVLAEMVLSGRGYKRVNVYRNGKMEQHGVHCLVARAFFGEPEWLYVNHIDFDVTNNNVCNLEYVTPAENVRHSARHGRLASHPGSSNPMAKLMESDVVEIAKRIRCYDTDKHIADDYGLCRGAVVAIRLGRLWSHLTGFTNGSNRFVRGRARAQRMMNDGVQLVFIEKEKSTGVEKYAYK